MVKWYVLLLMVVAIACSTFKPQVSVCTARGHVPSTVMTKDETITSIVDLEGKSLKITGKMRLTYYRCLRCDRWIDTLTTVKADTVIIWRK